MDHELERVGLHQLGHRSVAERDVRFADLARHITVGRRDRPCTRSERRINAPETVRSNTERENAGAGQNTSCDCWNTMWPWLPPCLSQGGVVRLR